MEATKRWRQRMLLPTLVLLGVVSTAVGSLGAPLLPTITTEMNVSVTSSQWALTISLLTGAIAAPVLGRLGDGRHRREVIIGVLVLVAVGCGLSALPLGFGWLLVGRALQGVGLGLVPLAIAAGRDALPEHRQHSGLALIGVTTAVGLGIGYPVAGVITEYAGLDAAFWFGAALTLLSALVAAWALPQNPDRRARPLDVAGAVLLGAAMTAVLLVCAEGSVWGWASAALLGTICVAMVSGAIWIWWELRCQTPLVDLRLLSNRSVLAADIMVVLVGIGIYPLLSLVVRYVETPGSAGYGLGYSVAIAGLMLVPYSLGSFFASRAAVRAMRRSSLEVLVAISCAILIAAMVVFLCARSSLAGIMITMALAGIGIGVVFAVNPVQISRGVPVEETGSANSFYQVLRYVGYSVGSALSATLLVANTADVSETPTEHGYSAAAWMGIGVLIVATIVGLILSRSRRHVDEDVNDPPIAVVAPK